MDALEVTRMRYELVQMIVPLVVTNDCRVNPEGVAGHIVEIADAIIKQLVELECKHTKIMVPDDGSNAPIMCLICNKALTGSKPDGK